jgi:hypothetical protein
MKWPISAKNQRESRRFAPTWNHSNRPAVLPKNVTSTHARAENEPGVAAPRQELDA